jgi:hypothetical protein
MKWVEAIVIQNATNSVVIWFLEDSILTRFGCAQKIIINNAYVFSFMALVDLCQRYNIILGHSMTYYPQRNGFTKASNRNLLRIFRWILEDNKK